MFFNRSIIPHHALKIVLEGCHARFFYHVTLPSPRKFDDPDDIVSIFATDFSDLRHEWNGKIKHGITNIREANHIRDCSIRQEP